MSQLALIAGLLTAVALSCLRIVCIVGAECDQCGAIHEVRDTPIKAVRQVYAWAREHRAQHGLKPLTVMEYVKAWWRK